MDRNRIIGYWLLAGVILIFIQVVIGGVTRLTGSGLSITRWEIVTGTLPPLHANEWEEAFDLYKDSPQYQKLNRGMSMGEFKFIYFWEYFHRLWARWMGVVFLIPFLWFWHKKWLDRAWKMKLIAVMGMASLVASFGWIMVASGLVDKPWVSPFKLTLHLSLALILFSYVYWLSLQKLSRLPTPFQWSHIPKTAWIITFLIAGQIVLGGMMAGMKAGLMYPTYPTMNGVWFPSMLLDFSQWNLQFDQNPFLITLIQWLHRWWAMGVWVAALWVAWKYHQKTTQPWLVSLFPINVSMQMVWGIITLMGSIGQIPVFWGVWHQAWALIILMHWWWIVYQLGASTASQSARTPLHQTWAT